MYGQLFSVIIDKDSSDSDEIYGKLECNKMIKKWSTSSSSLFISIPFKWNNAQCLESESFYEFVTFETRVECPVLKSWSELLSPVSEYLK